MFWNGGEKRLSTERIEPSLLEVSGFDHKYKVVSHLPDLAATFSDDMAGIKVLRDDLAHAKDFVADEKALQRLLERLQKADHWIVELSRGLEQVNQLMSAGREA